LAGGLCANLHTSFMGATVTNLGDDGKLLGLHATNLVQVRNI